MEPEMNRFEARLRFVNENETLKEILNILSYATLFVSVYAFFYGLVVLFLREIPLGISYALTVLLPFLLVSLIARLVKAPRPCDLFDFYEKKPRGKHSFPDRAVFFAFAIGTLTLFVHFLLGLLTLGLALCLSVCRPLLGRAFVRDVVAGGLCGVFCSLIGYFLLIM